MESKGEELCLSTAEWGNDSLKLAPVHTENDEYKLGIWVRDDTRHWYADLCRRGKEFRSAGAWNQRRRHWGAAESVRRNPVPCRHPFGDKRSGACRRAVRRHSLSDREELGEIGENTEEGIFWNCK